MNRLYSSEMVLVILQVYDYCFSDFQDSSYEEILDFCERNANEFLKSGFNIPNRSLYDCVASFLKAKFES